MIRVLRPGGRFMCLEFSKVKPQELESLYDLYSFQGKDPVMDLRDKTMADKLMSLPNPYLKHLKYCI